ncbi:MAG: hypothetical protein ABIH11_09230 [Candidatus Altiarchaeota archaeon]
MMNASHSVIEEIMEAFGESDEKGVQLCVKFAKRYKGDYHLQKINGLLSDYADSGDSEKLSDAKHLLGILDHSRKFRTAGGGSLAIKDRRRFKFNRRRR